MANFFDACNRTMLFEDAELSGKVSRIEGDPGGTTKWGISQRSHPDLDIENLTMGQAIAIYFDEYWTPLGEVADLFQQLAESVFDFAVTSGVKTAAVGLQQTYNRLVADGKASDLAGVFVHLKEDGVIGPVSRKAIMRFCRQYGYTTFLNAFTASRGAYYFECKAQFRRSWFRRL